MHRNSIQWQSAGHRVISRNENTERLDSDIADIDQFERELEQFIPPPGSIKESRHLEKLRAIQRKSTWKTSPSVDGTKSSQPDKRRRHVTYTKGVDGNNVETELYWSEKTLVWSRGAVPIRKFSYEEEIRCACWAWMEIDSADDEEARLKSTIQSKKENGDSSSSPSQAKINDKRRDRKRSPYRFRALCIFLPSCMVIYHPHTGQEYIKRLDLNVRKVFELEVGILIQRETEIEDRKRFEAIKGGDEYADRPLATLFYLRRPFDELKGVEITDNIRYSGNGTREGIIPKAVSVSDMPTLQAFDEVDENIIMISIRPPLMVSYSLQNQCLRIYSYTHSHLPLKRHKEDVENSKFTADKAEQIATINSATLMRRATTDIIRPRPSTRQRLPPRKSARLENGNSRASIGAPRHSLVMGKRPRTSSNPGHVRRISAGLTPILGQGAFRYDEGGHADTDDENIQDVMQLLDEFDEVQEDSSLQSAPPGPLASSLAQGTNSHRRRTSRGVTLTSAQQGIPPTSMPLQRPFQKIRPSEGRRLSRARMSMAVSNSLEGNPVSVAMELTQKDEASKLALTASTDKAMSRGVSTEGYSKGQNESEIHVSSMFGSFSQAFAAVSLIEEIAIPSVMSASEGEKIEAFIKKTDGMTLIHIMIPFCSRLFTRQIIHLQSSNVNQYMIASQLPPLEIVDSMIKCQNALVVNEKSQHLLLLQAEQSNSLHLVIGAPGRHAVSSELNFDEEGISKLRQLPTHITLNKSCQIDLKIEPSCQLTSRVLAMCEIVLDPRSYREMQMAWIKSRPEKREQEWQILSDLLLHGRIDQSIIEEKIAPRPKLDELLGPLNNTKESAIRNSPIKSIWTEANMADIVEVLQWSAQESRSDLCRRTEDLLRIAQTILPMICTLGWWKWHDYWQRLVPSMNVFQMREGDNVIEERPLIDLDDLIEREKEEKRDIIPDRFKRFLPRVSMLLEVHTALHLPNIKHLTKSMSGEICSENLMNSIKIVEMMLKYKIGRNQLKRLPHAQALLMYKALRDCRFNPPIGWSARAYHRVGREDLSKQVEVALITDNMEDVSSMKLGQTRNGLFPYDYRLREVGEMLQSSRPIAVRGPEVASVEDQEMIAEKQRRVFVSASDRIKAVSIGRGMYNLLSAPFKSTEQRRILPICLRIKMLNNCIIQNREPDAESSEMEWPEFHNGVASALQLFIGTEKVESSWLYSQLKKEFNSRHAGFILGMGLLGQLKNLGKIHAHYYLSNRHSSTTIGILLGISFSFISSCDPLAKALMSIHLIHTLPTHSRPLKTSMLEQSAALIGLGFVFLASKDRWASRMAFKAIATDSVLTDDSQMLKRECFSLSAGVSLGLVCLGGGRKLGSLSGEIEKEIIPELEKLIKIFADENSTSGNQNAGKVVDEKQYSAFEWAPEISLATSPSSIALALIYLKSNRKDKADKMPLPSNVDQLDSIRPDMLMIRALCRNLIEFDQIEASSEWLHSILPKFLQFKDVKSIKQLSENSQLAFWSLRLGSIFAIGLKYAGSNNTRVRSCLMDQLHIYQSQIDPRPTNYFEKIRQQLIQSSVDVILNSLAMVLAGTGDVELLQHLRKAMYRIDNLRYGNYMANSMAIGLLFLGGGRYTLSTSDGAIAALLLSFYPRFPINAQDNRSHMQAYRHFWILAVESRLLSVEDVDTGNSIRMPVELEKSDGEIIALSTPCLLPQLDKVDSMKIASKRYFSSTTILSGSNEFIDTIEALRILYIKKKAADLSHNDDKLGKSSLRARTQGTILNLELPLWSGKDIKRSHDTSRSRQELQSLIKDNVHDEETQTLINALFPSGDRQMDTQEETFELFTLQSVLSCLLEDKMEILPIMINYYSIVQSFLNENSFTQAQLFQLQDFRSALDLYRVSEPDQFLLDGRYLSRLWNLMQEKMISQLKEEKEDHLILYLKRYAESVELANTAGWIINIRERRKFAALLLITEVPPLAILKEVRSLWKEQRTSMSSEVMLPFIKDVLSQIGYRTRLEVLAIIFAAWKQQQPST